MRILILLLFLLFVPLQAETGSGGPLKLIQTIGDERDDYTIFGTADALLTEQNDIYILNVRGNNLSHFDWNGKFIRKIGRPGQGPGDFNFPRSLAYHKGRLYVSDGGNRRMAILDLKSGKFKYIKEIESDRIEKIRFVLDNEKFIGIYSNIKTSRGRMGIVDMDFNPSINFFKTFPIDWELKRDDQTFKTGMSVKQAVTGVVLNQYFEPVYDYDKKSNEIFVSFQFPDNPIKFFIYNTEGKLKKEFSYTIKDKRYKFNRFFLEASMDQIRDLKNYPARFELNASVFIYKDYYIAFLALFEYKAKENKSHDSHHIFLVFNKEGKLIKEYPLAKRIMPIRVSNGYILAKILEEEIDRLYIYQLEDIK